MSATAPAPNELQIQQPVYRPGSAVLLSLWPFEQALQTHHAGIVTYGHPKAEPDKIKTVIMNPLRLSMPGSDPVDPKDLWTAKYEEPVACPWGQGYVRIHLVDTYVFTRDWQLEGENSGPVVSPKRIAAQSVAASLIKAFSGGRIGDGIYGGAGMAIYDPTRTLESQLADMHATQMQLAISLYDQATEMAAKREFRNITAYHRVLAEWAGLPKADWMIERKQRATKPCPNCAGDIPAMAIQCTQTGCGVNLIKFAQDYGIGLDDLAVQAVLTSIGRKAKPEPEVVSKKQVA